MKKISLILTGVVLAFAGIAQQSELSVSSIKGEGAEINTISPKNTTPISYMHNNAGSLAAAGDTIAYYDFNSATGLVLTGNATRGWSLGTNNSWWSNQGIQSTSGADWACLKPGDPRAGALSAATYTMTTAAINCSGRNAVVMSFEQFHARFEDTTSVQVSTDGVNFTTVFDNMDLPITSTAGSNPTPNPQKITVNISQFAANQSTVYIRFQWRSRQQVQPGIGYGWWIDDLMIFEGANNDLAMDEVYWRPYTDSTFIHYADFYTQIPNKQARQYPMRFGAKFTNLGGATQRNAGYEAMISGPGGFSQTQTATVTSLSPLASDSTSTTTDVVLTAGTGVYNVDLVATSDSSLTFTDDDTLGGAIIVSDEVYARDNNDLAGAAAFYYNPSGVWEWEVGVLYEIKETDSLVAVEWINTASNKRNPNKLGKVSVHVYNAGNYSSTGVGVPASAPIFSSQPIDIKDLRNDSPGANSWVRTEVSRVAGGTGDTIGAGNYIVTLRGDQNFGSDTVFWPVQRTDFVNTQYFARVAQSGSSTMGNWSLGGRKYMIRMITAPTICPTLVGAVATGTPTTACGNTDGQVTITTDPTNGVAPFNYAWDISGTINTSKTVTGLGAGTYDVTITDANGCKVTTSAGVSDFGAPTVTLDNANSTLTTTCFGQQQGEITINIVPGNNPNPNYSFKWIETSNSSVTLPGDSTASNLEAGNYLVEVNDGSTPPCVQSLNVSISGPTTGISAAVANSLDNECKGDVRGEVELVLTGGTGNLSIAWADGSTTTARTGLAAGSYAYTVTDGNSCTLTGSHQVTEPSNPFVIVPPRYNSDITSTSSGITEVDAKNVELEVKTSGGVTSNIREVEWRNPLGRIVFGETSTKLKVGADERNDRDGSGDYSAIATSTIGCKSASVVFKVFETEALYPMSVTEFGTNSMLNVYPNPTTGSLNVSLSNTQSGTYSISIQNVVGQTIFSKSFDSNGSLETVIDLNDTDAGVYFLNINNGVNEISKKIVVE